MKKTDPPRLEFRLWPLSIVAEGHHAINTMRWPLRLVLVALAVAVLILAFRWR